MHALFLGSRVCRHASDPQAQLTRPHIHPIMLAFFLYVVLTYRTNLALSRGRLVHTTPPPPQLSRRSFAAKKLSKPCVCVHVRTQVRSPWPAQLATYLAGRGGAVIAGDVRRSGRRGARRREAKLCAARARACCLARGIRLGTRAFGLGRGLRFDAFGLEGFGFGFGFGFGVGFG